MAKLIITRGLSGSGKTTWAKDFCRWEPTCRFRVNRDDLRGMLYGGYAVASGYELEQLVTKVQHETIRELLARDKTVVVDDTNLALKHAKALAKLAYEAGALFEVNDDFLTVSVEEAIRRDAARDVSARVGREVIQRQYDRFVRGGLQPVVYTPPAGQELEPYEAPAAKPEAIIVDIDGTIADMGDRNPFDWAAVGNDAVKEEILEIVQRYAGYTRDRGGIFHIIFMSGRDEVCRKETLEWLELWAEVIHDSQRFDEVDERGYRVSDHNVHLFMRPAGDNRPDNVVKLELFNQHIRNNFDIHFVLDDRDQVVDMWRKLGLTCLQVAPGAF